MLTRFFAPEKPWREPLAGAVEVGPTAAGIGEAVAHQPFAAMLDFGDSALVGLTGIMPARQHIDTVPLGRVNVLVPQISHLTSLNVGLYNRSV